MASLSHGDRRRAWPHPVLWFILALATALVLLSVFPGFFLPREESATVTVKEPERHRPPVPMASPAEVTLLPIAADAAASLGSPEATAEDDLSTIELLLTEYARHHQGNPVGENSEITAALLGKNPRKVAFLADSGPFLNGSGELVDRWGTPYFFHQESARSTGIRSAGPDGIHHTADDVAR
ncbi:MAG: hypothetical protein KF712_04235 [Akkermansiaceae bacterium]|nr:hypothetical protein [Akkermansiaceae bacterium]